MEKQIQKIMWAIFRQHVHDGMSRLGMQAVPLPLYLYTQSKNRARTR